MSPEVKDIINKGSMISFFINETKVELIIRVPYNKPDARSHVTASPYDQVYKMIWTVQGGNITFLRKVQGEIIPPEPEKIIFPDDGVINIRRN